MVNPKPQFDKQAFDAVMNYRWYHLVRRFFTQSSAYYASEFTKDLTQLLKPIDQQFNQAMMNVASSLDTPRLISSLFNRHLLYKVKASPGLMHSYHINHHDAKIHQLQKLFLCH